MKSADFVPATGAVDVASQRGVHFTNEILNYHKVGDQKAEHVLLRLLLPKTAPDFFDEQRSILIQKGESAQSMANVLVAPTKSSCTTRKVFLRYQAITCRPEKWARAIRLFDSKK